MSPSRLERCPWEHLPAVDVITPTLGRPDVHEQLHACFDAQTLRQKRLFVLDESREPSRFFTRLRDPRVVYTHAPNKNLSGAGQGGIARARNRLVSMTGAPIVAHADDDDCYAPNYLEEMSSRLGSYDLVKLDVWQMLTETGDVFLWDTRTFSGEVWAVKGGEPPAKVNVESDPPPDELRADMIDAYRVGFGFSYLYRRSLWERFKFPEDEQTEDIPWVRRARKNGARIKFVSDLAHLCLHVVHPRSGSVNFPQRKLAKRMTGALPDASWKELPSGEPISVAPGKVFSVLASIKDKHTMKSLFSRCAQWSLEIIEARDKLSPGEFKVKAPEAGYRLVHIVGRAGAAHTLPWSVPSPINVFDKSSVIRAWEKAAVG